MSKVFGLLSERNSGLRSRHRQLNIFIINAESLSLLHQNLSNITNVSCRFNLAPNPEQQKKKKIIKMTTATLMHTPLQCNKNNRIARLYERLRAKCFKTDTLAAPRRLRTHECLYVWFSLLAAFTACWVHSMYVYV